MSYLTQEVNTSWEQVLQALHRCLPTLKSKSATMKESRFLHKKLLIKDCFILYSLAVIEF